MNRKTFLKTTAATLLATSVEGLQAKGFAAATPPTAEGLQVRFLGTGAADWNGRDERGEHRRLSSILLDDKIFIDLTATNLEMIPAEAHPETIFYTHSHGDHYHPASALRAGIKRPISMSSKVTASPSLMVIVCLSHDAAGVATLTAHLPSLSATV